MNSPQGNWINKAQTYEISGNILTAELTTDSGTLNKTSVAIYKDIVYDNINGNFTISECKNTIFICPENQLGNCLRSIVSGFIIAKYFGYNVYIDYEHALNKCKIKENKQMLSLFGNYCIMKSDKLYKKLEYSHHVTYNRFYPTNYDLVNEGRLLINPGGNFAITNTIYSIIPGFMTEEDYIREKIGFYRSVKFPDFLRIKVHDFLGKHDLSTYVGFHIRYTDNLDDESKNNLHTPFDIFVEKLKECNRVFLCSDNKQVLEIFQGLKSDHLLIADYVDDPDFQPLYEMMLLSQTQRIIGSNSSTFSYESAFFRGTDIELYENGSWSNNKLSLFSVS